MVHYSQYFNTLFRNKTFVLIKLCQVCELRFNGNGSTKWTRNRQLLFEEVIIDKFNDIPS